MVDKRNCLLLGQFFPKVYLPPLKGCFSLLRKQLFISGGWLLVSNIVIGSTPPYQLLVKTSYRGITSDQMVLTKTAMNGLRSLHGLSFTQLRFHCSKKNGRTFHVTT